MTWLSAECRVLSAFHKRDSAYWRANLKPELPEAAIFLAFCGGKLETCA